MTEFIIVVLSAATGIITWETTKFIIDSRNSAHRRCPHSGCNFSVKTPSDENSETLMMLHLMWHLEVDERGNTR